MKNSMASERKIIEIEGIPVEILRKRIKNINLSVRPPGGHVRVSAPLHVDDKAIMHVVASRMDWIRRHQQNFQIRDIPPEPKFVTGESHPFFGQQCRLEVIQNDDHPSVRLLDHTIELRVLPGCNREMRRAALDAWYRMQLERLLPDLVAKWEPLVGVKVAQIRIRKMKTRWGTCNTMARRIWLNLELTKKPLICLEYILVHEMVHIHERLHNNLFRDMMDKFMPNWREYQAMLNQQDSPLRED